MVYNYNYVVSTAQNQISSPTTTPVTFGRVIDIVLDESHPDFLTYGRSLAIGGIRYKPLGSSASEEDPTSFPFAYPINPSFHQLPLIDEIIEVVEGPSLQVGDNSIQGRNYYRSSINVWNHPHHNAIPDLNRSDPEARLGEGVIEIPSVNALYPFPGDLLIQGRTGQSIRFSSYKSTKNRLIDDNNNSDPLTILRVSKQRPTTGLDLISENIDTDDSSIYLTTNHSLDLTVSNRKRDTYTQLPTNVNVFKGSQIAINSDRIVLNAKEDHIIVSSNQSFGVSSDTINLDSTSYIGLDSSRILLGSRAKEPVVRGDKNENLLRNLIKTLNDLATTLTTLPPEPTSAIATLAGLGQRMTSDLKDIITVDIPSIKSTKVFTE